MGIIAKQSITGSILIYVGTIFGFVNSVLLFPRIFSTEQIGLIGLLVMYSVLLSQVASLGFPSAINKIFPYFRDKDRNHNGFSIIMFVYLAVGAVFISILFFLFYPYLISGQDDNLKLLVDYGHLILPLILFTQIFNVFDNYTKSNFNATRGFFLKELLLRIMILLSAVACYINRLEFNGFMDLYVIFYALIALYLFIFLLKEKNLSVVRPPMDLYNKHKKQIFTLSMFGILAGSVGNLTLYVDRFMLQKLVPEGALSSIGIYVTCSFFPTMIIMPARALIKIASPLIGEAWKRNDNATLNTIYSKSTTTLLIVGIFLFLGMWLNIDTVFKLLPKDAGYENGKWVIFFLGLFQVCDMASGVGHVIIGNSKFFKWLTYQMGILAVLVVITNLLFIPTYGIVGAAAASFISKLVFNFIKWFFIYKRFKLNPFGKKEGIILLWGTLVLFGIGFIPSLENYIVDLLVRSAIIAAVFLGPLYLLSFSEDLNKATVKAFQFVGIKLPVKPL